MAESYDHKEVEARWQAEWEKSDIYRAEDFGAKPKYYVLVEFPYPSGDGLHVGHPRPYIGLDIIARKRRMEGYNVLYPMGWDAFGLPTENYAIKTGVHPAVVTKQNSDNFRRQIKMLGASFDWSREVNTTDPKYYKWTQWIFLQLYKNGLAYKGKMAINWCPSCKIGLANEEVIQGKCERCGSTVEQREKDQWMLAITKYTNRLEKDLDKVDYPDSVKTQQRNWLKNLHDWVFSRQRYWGEPIPMIFCEKCGWQTVPEEDLPVVLPEVENYQPRDDGESPLASVAEWVNVKCPKCRGEARRETDTMPNWAGSSWYYLRYLDPDNQDFLASPEKIKHWSPVDWYNGGMEHTTLHLLYSRFWHKFLFDIGVVPSDEPYQKRTSHGLILAVGGAKMSKSKGNVVNPDKIVELYGADTLRVYEMFMGPFEQAVVWSDESIIGSRRFLEKVWRLSDSLELGGRMEWSAAVERVSKDIEAMKFNTAISFLMILLNGFKKEKVVYRDDYKVFLKLLAPFAPHLTEELWKKIGEEGSIHNSAWPVDLTASQAKR
ncbi:class I tRNA ligase family protein [Candidatus Nomurabacteria bacterium]|nr:class I tRNA ligase family protein [Candidatus Nomurabacteria bacterium]